MRRLLAVLAALACTLALAPAHAQTPQRVTFPSLDGKTTLTGYQLYEGASHNFDDPSARHQKVEANAAATEDARKRAVAFFKAQLGTPR